MSCQHTTSTHFITPQPRCGLCCSSERYTSISSIVISNCSNQPESHAGRQTACVTEPEAEKKEEKCRKISILHSPSVACLYILNWNKISKIVHVFSFSRGQHQVHYPFSLQRHFIFRLHSQCFAIWCWSGITFCQDLLLMPLDEWVMMLYKVTRSW